MGFLDIFIVALMPVLKVLLVTGVGLFIGTEKINLLGPEARNYLNNIVFYLLNPCLLVSNLAETITMKSLVTLWFMPINVLLTFLIGSALGWILIKITKTPKHLRGIVIGCCSAGNLGNLLLIILPALCEESNSPFSGLSTCSTDAQAYATLSMALGAILIWTYMYSLMSAYAITNTEQTSIQSSEGDSIPSLDTCTEPLLLSSHSQISEDPELPLTDLQERKKMSFTEKIVHCLKSIPSKIDLKKVFAPSTIASIIGFIIGIVSPIRKVLVGDEAPLRVIDSSAALIGYVLVYNSPGFTSDILNAKKNEQQFFLREAAIPSMTLIMGANLLKGLKRSEVNVKVVLGVLAVRNVCLPLLGMGVVKTAHQLGLVGSNSLYRFVLMIQYALPPAINVGTISQLFQSGQGETSVILWWSYAVASISLTLWSTLFMSIVT